MTGPEADAAARLLERLLADPVLRRRFRRDPVGASREAGVESLAEEMSLATGKAFDTLDDRESRSGLAGVFMAAALEGVAGFELVQDAAPHLEDVPEAVGRVLSRVDLPAVPGLNVATAQAASPGNSAGQFHAVLPEVDVAKASDFDPDQFGQEGTGGPAPAEDAALLDNKRVTLDADAIADLKAGKIDPRIASVLTAISKDHEITVSAMMSDHGMQTSGGSVSNHYYGRAVDIATVDGQPVGPDNAVARRIAVALSQMDPSIRPSEIGSPWALPGAAYFTDGEHQNHLHVAFDDPISNDWSPPDDLAPEGGLSQGLTDDSEELEDPTAPPTLEADDEDDDSDSEDDEEEEDDEPGGLEDPGGDTDAEADAESDGDEEDGDEDDNEPDDGDEEEDADDEEDEDEEDEDEEDEDEDEDDGDDSATGVTTDSDSGAELDSDSDSADPGDSSGSPLDLGDVDGAYPGDDASQAQLAAWMGAAAQKRGLPPELPVMASLVESNLKNVNYGDADSVGFFQMRVGIWNQGEYAGYPERPELQLKWFLDKAAAVKQQGGSSDDPGGYGEWVANVENPAAEYRGRYQPRLAEARDLLREGMGSRGRGDDAGDDGAVIEAASENVGAAAGPRALAAVAEAKRYLGTPYQWGGSSPKTGFDCSGLVQWAFAKSGIRVPRTSEEQILASNGTPVGRKHLLPGDLVFFRDASGDVHHVGISLGGDKFIAAPQTGDVVKISSLDEPYYAEQFTGGRRFDAAGEGRADAAAAAVRPGFARGVDPDAAREAEAALARDAAEVQRPGTMLWEAVRVQERRKGNDVQFLKAVTPPA